MEYLAHNRITVIPLADGVAFAFPRPWLSVGMRQRVVALFLALIGAVLLVGVYYIGLLLIPAVVLYIAFTCLFREEAVSRFTGYLHLVFSDEMARRDGERTRSLCASGDRLIRTNCAGASRTWHRGDIADIHTETSPQQDGVLASIVLRDRQGRRSILHEAILSVYGYLPEREELAYIAGQLRQALDLPIADRVLPDELVACPVRGSSHAIMEKTTHVREDQGNHIQRSAG